MLQALTNLVSNAIKFSNDGQTIALSADVAGGRDLEISVHDEGRGIPPEHLHTIFQRFRQVDPTDPRERSGSGLGLAVVERIVIRHGAASRRTATGSGPGPRSPSCSRGG